MKNILEEIGRKCPDCGNVLHIKTEKDRNEIEYCKNCGYRNEVLR